MKETYNASWDVQFLGAQGGNIVFYKGCLAVNSIFEVTLNFKSNYNQILKADWAEFVQYIYKFFIVDIHF